MFQFRELRNGRERKRRYFVAEGRKTQEEALALMIREAAITAWNKCYHRDLFRENRYPKGRVYEDVFLTPFLVHEARCVFYSSAVLYNKECRDDSISADLSEGNARDWLDARTSTARLLKEWGHASMAESYYLSGMLVFASMGWQAPEANAKCDRYLRGIKHCPQRFPFKQRCKLYLWKFSPKLCRLVLRIYRQLRFWIP